MLASLIASTFTGHYTYSFLPFLLPTPLILALLPPDWIADDQSPFLSSQQLQAAGIDVPTPPAGYSWICIEAGQQIKTGMNAPGGRMTFFEAKLEIPFLGHPSSSTATPYTFKQTLLFSTSLMAASSHYITGLRSQKAGFKVNGGTYKATGWMEIRERAAGGASGQSWTEQLVRQVVGGWWAGERTGGVATRFLTTPCSPSSPSSFSLRLHLPSFTKHSVEQVRALISEREGAEPGRLKLDGEGWLELDVEGWKLDEDVKMQVGKAGEM